MRYDIIATGSKGNCLLLPGPTIVDLGVTFKALKGHLAEFGDSAPVVFLTHRHGDHFNPATARALLLEHPGTQFITPLMMEADVVKAIGENRYLNMVVVAGFMRKDGYRVTNNGKYKIGFFCEDTYHDAPNVCWHISIMDVETGNAERIFYATDTGHLDGITAKGYDYYFIEGNHTRAEIEQRAKEKIEAGQYAYEFRAAQNHLCTEQALDFIAENAGPNSKYILMHSHLGEN